MAGRYAMTRSRIGLATGIVALSAYSTYSCTKVVANESPSGEKPEQGPSRIRSAPRETTNVGPFSAWVWGSNKNDNLQPRSFNAPVLKGPRVTAYIPSTPLRDLALAEKYGAAVDVRGDVWIWGAGHFDDGVPSDKAALSLKGKNIESLAATDSKLYALSKHSGQIYGVSSKRSRQQLQPRQPERYPWWMLGLGAWFRQDPGVDYVQLVPAGGLSKGEKFTSLVSGSSHILALTNKGRAFSMATNTDGNSHMQLGLGIRRDIPVNEGRSPEDIRWTDTLNPIMSLNTVEIAQVAAGLKSSYFRMADGRVLAMGANNLGQLGIGALASVEVVPTPSEIVLARSYPGGITVKCTNIAAGGNNAFYTVERSNLDGTQTFVDLLAVGTGISGGLGNGLWSSASSSPVKVKSVSGLQEYSEALRSFIPLEIKAVSVGSSPTAHIFATLNTVTQSEQSGVLSNKYGDDVVAWGANVDYNLGTGKRSNVAVPQHLSPLAGKIDAESREASMTAGTLTPMPHSRLQLHTGQGDAYDLDGRLLKRNVKAAQVMYAGYNASASYWRAI